MGFCIKCGKEVAEDALFCSKCGARTAKGVEAGVSLPSEAEDMFSKVGREMEKAGEEIEKAFETAWDKIRESVGTGSVKCPSCGGSNPSNSRFCRECGKSIS